MDGRKKEEGGRGKDLDAMGGDRIEGDSANGGVAKRQKTCSEEGARGGKERWEGNWRRAGFVRRGQ